MPSTPAPDLRILWICGLPAAVQQVLNVDEEYGPRVAWSWILSHFPPPDGVELHVGCLLPGAVQRKSLSYEGTTFHTLPCPRRGRALLLFQRDHQYFRPLVREL